MDLKNLLKSSAESLNIQLSDLQIEQFIQYKDLLIENNKKFNLTSIIDEKDIILKHFIDSLSLSTVYDLSQNISIIDIGSGAGFPGIPLKIAFPTINLTIVDSLSKRINFLTDLSNQLGLENVTCIHGRAEILGQDEDYREKFDIATSRAVAYLPTLSEYCIPFVKKDGYFLPLKSTHTDDELKEANYAVETLGGSLEKIESYTIPQTDIIQSIIFIHKKENTSSKFPRKSNQIKNKPLKKA